MAKTFLIERILFSLFHGSAHFLITKGYISNERLNLNLFLQISHFFIEKFMNTILQLLMFSNFWMRLSIIWRVMQIEEGIIWSPFFGDYPVLLASLSVNQKLLPNLVNNSLLWSGINRGIEPIRNGEMFWMNDKTYWPRTVFLDISIGQETSLCICFLFFFLLSGLSYRVIWQWRCDVYSLFANTQSFATPESDLTIWKNESKFVMSAWPVAYFWCIIVKELSQWGQYNRKLWVIIGFN